MIASLSVPLHSGTGAGEATSRRPSATSSPISAWVIDFAMLHEISVVSASTACSGSKTLAGFVPYCSATTAPRCITTTASEMPSSVGRVKNPSTCASTLRVITESRYP